MCLCPWLCVCGEGRGEGEDGTLRGGKVPERGVKMLVEISKTRLADVSGCYGRQSQCLPSYPCLEVFVRVAHVFVCLSNVLVRSSKT